MEETAVKGGGGGGPLQVNEHDFSDAIELFEDCKEDDSMLDAYTVPYEPTHIESSDDFEFHIPPQGTTYIQLPSSRLHIKARILDEAGNRMVDTDVGKVAYANLPVAAMFSRIDISLDGVPVPDLSNSYSNYKGYLETMLSYSKAAFEQNLITAGAFADTPENFNQFTFTGDADDPQYGNKGFGERSIQVGRSNTLEWMSPIHCDFFQMGKYFPPGVKITLRLTRSPNAFVICSSATTGGVATGAPRRFKLKIEQITLYMRHITMNASILSHHQRLLESKKKLYLPYKKTEIKVFGLAAGIDDIYLSSIINDNLPYSIILGFIKSTNFYGAYNRNCWFFENHDIDDIQLSVNGVQMPCKPYKPNFGDNNFTREYREFLDNTGISHGNVSNMMTPLLYKEGLCLWAWDLSPDMCNGYHFHPRRMGQVNLHTHFKTRLPEPITLVVMCLHHAKLILEKDKKTTYVS
jgi:hypothetical protein